MHVCPLLFHLHLTRCRFHSVRVEGAPTTENHPVLLVCPCITMVTTLFTFRHVFLLPVTAYTHAHTRLATFAISPLILFLWVEVRVSNTHFQVEGHNAIPGFTFRQLQPMIGGGFFVERAGSA